jgi:hypothetical protein
VQGRRHDRGWRGSIDTKLLRRRIDSKRRGTRTRLQRQEVAWLLLLLLPLLLLLLLPPLVQLLVQLIVLKHRDLLRSVARTILLDPPAATVATALSHPMLREHLWVMKQRWLIKHLARQPRSGRKPALVRSDTRALHLELLPDLELRDLDHAPTLVLVPSLRPLAPSVVQLRALLSALIATPTLARCLPRLAQKGMIGLDPARTLLRALQARIVRRSVNLLHRRSIRSSNNLHPLFRRHEATTSPRAQAEWPPRPAHLRKAMCKSTTASIDWTKRRNRWTSKRSTWRRRRTFNAGTCLELKCFCWFEIKL